MNKSDSAGRIQYWPALPSYDQWKSSCDTLHLWLQIVGKIRLVQSPWVNHSWHVPFYVTARGLTTSIIPYRMRTFQIDFDFIDHQVLITTCEGQTRTLNLDSRSVASFYHEIMDLLAELGIHIQINTLPSEMAEQIPFEKDFRHKEYDARAIERFHMVLTQADRVLKIFRARFRGKCSPVHFFWGGMDMAVTRFSGRKAPQHPGGIPHLPDWVVQDAYDQEVSSCGFWPGSDGMPHAAFYSYAYPEPTHFARGLVSPKGAFYSHELKEFILPYGTVRSASSPDDMLLQFAQSTYELAANLGRWDRQSLESAGGFRKAA